MLAVLHALLVVMQCLPAITCPRAEADHANLLLHVCLVGKFGKRALHLNFIPFLQAALCQKLHFVAQSFSVDALMLIQYELSVKAARTVMCVSNVVLLASCKETS